MGNFKPYFTIKPTDGMSVILEIVNPDDRSESIMLVKDGVDSACYEVMEVYNAVEGDYRQFRDWEHAYSFYENESWVGDDELDIDFGDDLWEETEDD